MKKKPVHSIVYHLGAVYVERMRKSIKQFGE